MTLQDQTVLRATDSFQKVSCAAPPPSRKKPPSPFSLRLSVEFRIAGRSAIARPLLPRRSKSMVTRWPEVTAGAVWRWITAAKSLPCPNGSVSGPRRRVRSAPIRTRCRLLLRPRTRSPRPWWTVSGHFKASTAPPTRLSEIEHKPVQMAEKHARERKALQEARVARWKTETLQRQARFRKGLRGLFDRLGRQHRRIKKQNEQET